MKECIREMEACVKQIRDAITASKKAYDDLKSIFENSSTVASEGRKRLSSLLDTASQLELQFAEHLKTAGFEDEQAYQQAKMSEEVVKDSEKQLKKYGEQRKSLTDQAAALREKLNGKERVDVSRLEQQQQQWKEKRRKLKQKKRR